MIGVLAAIESMSIGAEDHSLTCGPKLRTEFRDVKVVLGIGYQSLVGLGAPMGPQRQVLVEWLKYDAKWSIGEKLFPRIILITEVLSSVNRTRRPGVLWRCEVFHDLAEHVSSQVYNIPSRYGKEKTSISSTDILFKTP